MRAWRCARNDRDERAQVIYELAFNCSTPIVALARAAVAQVHVIQLLRSNHSTCSSGGGREQVRAL